MWMLFNNFGEGQSGLFASLFALFFGYQSSYIFRCEMKSSVLSGFLN